MRRFLRTMTVPRETMFVVRHDSDANVVEVLRWDASGSPVVVDKVSYRTKEDAAANPNSVMLSEATEAAVEIMMRRYWDEMKKRKQKSSVAAIDTGVRRSRSTL